MTLDTELERYAAELHRFSPRTQAAYLHDLTLFRDYCLQQGIAAWHGVNTAHVRDFLSARHRQGIGARSLQRTLSALRGFMRFQQIHAGLPDNPLSGVRAPKVRRALPHVLDPDQSARLVSIESDEPLGCRDKALLELAYSSGLRVAELAGLSLADLDLTAGDVRVIGKGNKTRVVPVGRAACEALLAWLAQRNSLAAPEQTALFVNRRGGRLSIRGIQLLCARWGIRQGIDRHVHPHMLRHSFASHVLESSGDLRAVQELLGHADIRTTQVYTHLDFQHLAKVYDAAHPRARHKRRPEDDSD